MSRERGRGDNIPRWEIFQGSLSLDMVKSLERRNQW